MGSVVLSLLQMLPWRGAELRTASTLFLRPTDHATSGWHYCSNVRFVFI